MLQKYCIFVTRAIGINMENSINSQIVKRIKNQRRGKLVFPGDFAELGNVDAVKTSLSRLAKEGKLQRIAHGIYLYPKQDPVLGTLYPSMEEIAQAIAKRDKARIMPTGPYALHKLGLTTQVPMKVVFLTDGAARKIKIGKRHITFKNTTPKKLATKGKISTLVIQALQEIGKERVNDQVLNRIKAVLQKEDSKTIKEDAKLAPAWIANILYSSIDKSDTHA